MRNLSALLLDQGRPVSLLGRTPVWSLHTSEGQKNELLNTRGWKVSACHHWNYIYQTLVFIAKLKMSWELLLCGSE